jgi:hypothetical protein
MARFTYNDIVQARGSAEANFRPGERAWIIAVLEDRSLYPFPSFPPGAVYTVEFEDGDALDVPEDYLQAAD